MGYIYKITNSINGKVYIGQTVKTLQKRFIQHKNNCTKSYFSQLAIYKAFNKYGIDNFVFEKIEEIPNKLLDEREKYWIEEYDSYFNGYNSTLGGRLVQLYDWDVDEIIELYHQYKSARKVAIFIGCDHSTIDNILNANGVKRYTMAQQLSRPVILKKDKENWFETTTAAAKWLIENNFTKMTNSKIVRQELTNRIRNGKKYLGFEVYYESKI